MKILGINAFHGDASACLVMDGQLVAAIEEERLTRIKHWAGFPKLAIEECLKIAKIDLQDVDKVAVNRDPKAHFLRKLAFGLWHRPDQILIHDRLKNLSTIYQMKQIFAQEFGVSPSTIQGKICHVEHHLAHLASAYWVSPFSEAAVVSVDGFGDFLSTEWALGSSNGLLRMGQVYYPHSLGLLYMALTQFLGFPNYGDEYKVMGLAPYGQPHFLPQMRQLVRLEDQGRFRLQLKYFTHHKGGVAMSWRGGAPTLGTAYSPLMETLFGRARTPDEPIEKRHQDLAASLQGIYEEAFFHLLNHVYDRLQLPDLALAGGCAMNSVANGKIYDNTHFKKIYVQPAAGDAGGAIGAAFYVWHEQLKCKKRFVMEHAYWGPAYSQEEVWKCIASRQEELNQKSIRVERMDSEEELLGRVAEWIDSAKVVGWFQGRMEWGPRALGNRSILADPRLPNIKELLNLKIKHRESFRPFAPSILRHRVKEWFEVDDEVPFMLQVYPILEAKRASIPAVTHVNGSGRLQTVTEPQNPLYFRLIQAFEKRTGVPILLNTSFNENEPVVCKPQEALDCFVRTQMDALAIGPYLLSRR